MTVNAVGLPPDHPDYCLGRLPRRVPGATLHTFGPIAVLADRRRLAGPAPDPVAAAEWTTGLLRSVAADVRRQGNAVFEASDDLVAAGAELVEVVAARLPTPVRLAGLPPHTSARQLGALVEISLHAAAAELAGEVAGAVVLDEDLRTHVAYGLGGAGGIAWPQGVTCIGHAVQLTREGRLPKLLGLDTDTGADVYGQLIFTETVPCPFCTPLAVP